MEGSWGGVEGGYGLDTLTYIHLYESSKQLAREVIVLRFTAARQPLCACGKLELLQSFGVR